MGAIKPNNYTQNELNVALIADAISHPIRKRMVEILHNEIFMRNIDFAKQFKLTKPTIQNHLQKLKNAGLIHCIYHTHFYEIKLNANNFSELIAFINVVNDAKNDE